MASLLEMRRYVDRKTGEVIATQTKALPNYFDPAVGYRMMARRKSVRTFPAVKFPKELTRTDMGHLLFLVQAMWAETGVLGKTVRRSSFRPFNDDELLLYLGFKLGRKSRSWLAKMVRLSMLRSVDVNLPDGRKERHWYMNPIHFCPMFITRDAYLKWRDVVEKYCPGYVKAFFE